MIQLTRTDHTPVALNADLVERVETTDLTVVTLVDGSRYTVVESTAEVIERIVAYRAAILVEADRLAHSRTSVGGPRLRLVSDSKER